MTTNTQKQFSFRTLTNNDGLSQNSVISIAQDSVGYLWLATQNGLNKFDGRNFKYYDKQFEDITRSNYSKLGKIYIDKQNRIWIITHSGKLELFNAETKAFDLIESIEGVHSIFQDSQHNTFIGIYEKGLLKIDNKSKDTTKVYDSILANKTVNDFLEIENSIFIASSEKVYKINSLNSYEEYTIITEKKSNYSSFEKSKDGTIWLGSYGDGLFFKSPEKDYFERFTNALIPETLNIQDLLIDNKERLWIATYGNGVYLIDFKANDVRNFKANKNDPFAIHYNDMLCLYEDNTGVIWLGSDGTGASYYDEHLVKFNILTNNQVPNDVNVDVARSITTDDNNNIYIGTSGKGLTVFNTISGQSETLTISNSNLNSNRIISLNYNDNNLWIGHQGFGLNTVNTNGSYRTYPEISNYTIWNILDETKNKKWLSTEQNGLVLFDKEKGIEQRYTKDNSQLQSNNIRVAIKEGDNLWIGTDDTGVYQLNLKTNTINKIHNLDYKVKSLSLIDNNLWVGTNGNGLIKYNTLKTSVENIFTTNSGLPNNVIYGILEASDGDLWLSTNNGLSSFNPKETPASFESFNVYDGLQGIEFNTGAYHKDKNGTLYFGGLEGINWFNPRALTFNTTKPKTIISSFEVFSKEKAMTDNVKLKYDENTVTFSFSSLHFSQPERSAYKYQLTNHDEGWINSGFNNVAHYTNLPADDYTFKVISSNYDGVWNEQPATFKFTISKPWYASTTAYIVYTFLFAALIYSIYYYLKWRWHIKMQLQLEHSETERLKKLNRLKTKLYTNLSHEFRTPLTLIKGPIENQLNNPKLSKSDKKELDLVHHNSLRLLNLVDQLLDLSKLESGNYNLKASSGNLNALLKQLATAFQYQASEKRIKYHYRLTPIDNAFFDKDIIEKVVGNLLSNAVKYTPQEGEINFNTKEHNGQIIIVIANTCENINELEVGKLFQRYYQKNNNIDGVGIGLNLVKELCILSHGNVVVHALNDKKIQFTVTLPIERSFYSSDEVINENTKNKISTIASNNKIPKTVNDNNKTANKPILLIVEDDKDILKYVKSIFSDQYIIKTANNGEQGIEKALSTIPDIVISDIMMPKLNGLQLCTHLKQDERTSHIPIILLTAKSGEENELVGLETGADDYIVKPFSNKKLKLKVKKLIESRRKLQDKYSKTFEIDPDLNNTTEQRFLERLKKTLNEHIVDPKFNAKYFSKSMSMSRMQLHRKLKTLTGLTTSEFIRTERLKIAKKLLKEDKSTVSEVAYQVGFNTPSYFIKSFKKAYNCTPTEFILK
ncbi:two-component regulator propeller domain-containing protein [Winogradskyella sp. A3E31]|uniref:two-component regulator propeller domain-containing protein n=1 Tax=Winogradskyella sp. A3E31 TaxID=3349637 RepID=UPI00398B6F93